MRAFPTPWCYFSFSNSLGCVANTKSSTSRGTRHSARL